MFTVANSQLSHTVAYLEQLEARGKVVLKALEADVANGDAKVKAAGTEVKTRVEAAFAKITGVKQDVSELMGHIEDFARNKGILADQKASDPEAGA